MTLEQLRHETADALAISFLDAKGLAKRTGIEEASMSRFLHRGGGFHAESTLRLVRWLVNEGFINLDQIGGPN